MVGVGCTRHISCYVGKKTITDIRSNHEGHLLFLDTQKRLLTPYANICIS